MPRDTQEITLPVSGKKALIKTYLTAREKISINRSCAKIARIGSSGEVEANAEMVIDYQNEMVRTGLVSLDGNAENCFEELLDLRFEDYRFVVEAIISNDSSETEKKTAQ